jgi:hypothetical protein
MKYVEKTYFELYNHLLELNFNKKNIESINSFSKVDNVNKINNIILQTRYYIINNNDKNINDNNKNNKYVYQIYNKLNNINPSLHINNIEYFSLIKKDMINELNIKKKDNKSIKNNSNYIKKFFLKMKANKIIIKPINNKYSNYSKNMKKNIKRAIYQKNNYLNYNYGKYKF